MEEKGGVKKKKCKEVRGLGERVSGGFQMRDGVKKVERAESESCFCQSWMDGWMEGFRGVELEKQKALRKMVQDAGAG